MIRLVQVVERAYGGVSSYDLILNESEISSIEEIDVFRDYRWVGAQTDKASIVVMHNGKEYIVKGNAVDILKKITDSNG